MSANARYCTLHYVALSLFTIGYLATGYWLICDTMTIIRWFCLAVQFLTIFPLRLRTPSAKDLGRSMMFYPVVGYLLGCMIFLSHSIFSSVFYQPADVALAFIVWLVLSGGLHLDGFADVCDGFYAGKDKESILRVMKDSRVGTMAVLGLFCLLSLKLVFLYDVLRKGYGKEVFFIVPSISRWMMTVAAWMFPYARVEGGTALPFVEHAGTLEAAVSSVFLAVIVYVFSGYSGVMVVMLTFASGHAFLKWVHRKIDGVTGDVLGALNEVSETVALMALSLAPVVLRKVSFS